MMSSRVALFVLLIVSLTSAAPISSESNPTVLIAMPVYVNDGHDTETKVSDDTYPMAYALLLAPSEDSLVSSSDALNVAKRSTEQSELDDLETAAGTNALRPLFVYRQQVAYRQRVREALRRGNRF